MTIWLALATAAAAWWWLMPGGFPVWHGRFWANRVVPISTIAVATAALVLLRRRQFAGFRALSLALTIGCTAAATAFIALFPISSRRLTPLALIAVAFLWLLCWLAFRRTGRPGWRTYALAVFFAAVGSGLPFAEEGPAPRTRPANAAVPRSSSDSVAAGGLNPIEAAEGTVVRPSDGAVTIRHGSMTLEIAPLLTFVSRSPDRCWTILAPRRERRGPPRRLYGIRNLPDGVELGYQSDGDEVLRVRRSASLELISVDAWCELPRPVYSHLNSFCELRISGHNRLALSFSPCPDALIEVMPADYPVGRPIRAAYLDAGGTFHAVEGRSGEKGPFRQVAGGQLARSDPLTITIHDREQPIFHVELQDWPSQAATQLSPTAGWGLPVNAIEFRLLGDSAASPAAVGLTRAGTSVGRGWYSVGHAGGVYRNRMRVKLGQATPAAP